MWNFIYVELHDYYANFDSSIADECRICNWGLTNRNNYPELVLLDTGLSKDNYRKYYT